MVGFVVFGGTCCDVTRCSKIWAVLCGTGHNAVFSASSDNFSLSFCDVT